MDDVDKTVATAIEAYRELNASVIDELEELPSPLEFMRFVARNRPFVVRAAASRWKAVSRWNAAYLKDVMGEEQVQVAVTPLGYVVC